MSDVLGVKNVVWEPLRVFSLKRSTAEAFAVAIRELSYKTGPWYLLRVLCQTSDEHLRPFYMGVPQGNQYETRGRDRDGHMRDVAKAFKNNQSITFKINLSVSI